MNSEKLNCWEFKECGREPNGKNVSEHGVCPVAVESRLDGVHGGRNGGRCCWLVKYYLLKNNIFDECSCGFPKCLKCDFYCMVKSSTKLLVAA
ncbi:hypothetical protein VU12_07115 [Desulfobulbus sp. US4]|nr:hypothetical protein [Desulfobulbus sp. US4]